MNKQEYEEKLNANQRITGIGFETTMHMPCPFCAEPDFMIYRVLETEQALDKGAVCKHCGRGMKAILKRSEGGISFELVQTCGDPPPDYVLPLRAI
jgi:hypothetical protein